MIKIASQPIKIKDKYRTLKRALIIVSIIILIVIILATPFFFNFINSSVIKSKEKAVLENPLKSIIVRNMNSRGQANIDAVIQEGIQGFNQDYINYMIIALGVNNLHKSFIGYGNPRLELITDGEVWSSEINNKFLLTKKAPADDPDLKIIISKQEAVKALLSPNMEEFMRQSVYNGNTKIEIIAGKIELGSKGYLAMYAQLTGEEIKVEE